MIDTIKARRIQKNLERLKQLSESEQGARIGEHLEQLTDEEELRRFDMRLAQIPGYSLEKRQRNLEQFKALLDKEKKES